MKVKSWVPYFCIIPSLLLLIGMIYPFSLGVYNSFTNLDLKTTSRPAFVGITNYARVLRTNFWSRAAITGIYSVLALILQMSVGLGLAYLLNREYRGIRIIRSLVIIPLMVPPLISSMMWKTMMDPSIGVMNYLLHFFGISGLQWLADTKTALFSVILIDTWIFTPFVALILLAGFQALPYETIEAATIDGANAWQIFYSVMLPLLKPFVILALLFRLIDLLKTFDTVWATTQGGPATATTNIVVGAYRDGLTFGNMGIAMAYVTILFIFIMIITQLLLKLLRKGVTH